MERSNHDRYRGSWSQSNHDYRNERFRNDTPRMPPRHHQLPEDCYGQGVDCNDQADYTHYPDNAQSEFPDYPPEDQRNQYQEFPNSNVEPSMEASNGWYKEDSRPYYAEEFGPTEHLNREGEQLQDFEHDINREEQFFRNSDQTNRPNYYQRSLCTRNFRDDRMGQPTQAESFDDRNEQNFNQFDSSHWREECARGEEWSSSEMNDNGEFWIPPNERIPQLDERSHRGRFDQRNESDTHYPANRSEDRYHWTSKSYRSSIPPRGHGREERGRSRPRISSSFRGRGRGRETFERSSPIRDIRESRRRSRSPFTDSNRRPDERSDRERFDRRYEAESRYSSNFAERRRDTDEAYDRSDRYRSSITLRGRGFRERSRGRGRSGYNPSYRGRGRGSFESVRSPIRDRLGSRVDRRSPRDDRSPRRERSPKNDEIRRDRSTRSDISDQSRASTSSRKRDSSEKGKVEETSASSTMGEKTQSWKDISTPTSERNLKTDGKSKLEFLKDEREAEVRESSKISEKPHDKDSRPDLEKRSHTSTSAEENGKEVRDVDRKTDRKTSQNTREKEKEEEANKESSECAQKSSANRNNEEISKNKWVPMSESARHKDEPIKREQSRIERKNEKGTSQSSISAEQRHCIGSRNDLRSPIPPPNSQWGCEKEGEDRSGETSEKQRPPCANQEETTKEPWVPMAERARAEERAKIRKRLERMSQKEFGTPETRRAPDQSNLEGQCQPLKSQGSLEREGFSKVTFSIRRKSAETKLPRNVRKSSAVSDGEVEKDGNDWAPMSRKIFPVHTESMKRCESVKIPEDKEIRNKDQRNGGTRPNLNHSMPSTSQEGFGRLERGGSKGSETPGSTTHNEDIDIEPWMPLSMRKNRIEERNEKPERSENRYDPETSRRRSPDYRFSRRRREYSPRRFGSDSRSGSYDKRSKFEKFENSKRFQRLFDIRPHESNWDMRPKDYERREESRLRLEQRSKMGIISRALEPGQRGASRENITATRKRSRCRSGSPRRGSTPRDDRVRRSAQDVPRASYNDPVEAKRRRQSLDEPSEISTERRGYSAEPQNNAGERDYDTGGNTDSDRIESGDQTSTPIEVYSPSHADSEDFQNSRFQLFANDENAESGKMLDQKDSKSEDHILELASDMFPSTPESRNSREEEEINNFLSEEKGSEQIKASTGSLGPNELPPDEQYSQNENEEELSFESTQMIIDEEINVEDLDSDQPGVKRPDIRTMQTESLVVDTNISERTRPLRKRKNLCYSEEPESSLIKLEHPVKRENLRCKKEPNTDNDLVTHIDRVRQFAAFLILLAREMTEGTRLSVIPPISETNDFLESSFSFERLNPETDELEVEMFAVKYLISNEKGHNFTITYKMLLSECLINIRKLCESYTKHKNDLSDEDGTIRNFTVYTNLELNRSLLDRRGLYVIEGASQNCKKIQVSGNSEIFQKIPNQILSKIASTLVGAINKFKPVKFTPFLKTHHLALVRERVVKIEGIKTKLAHCTGVFHEDFIHDKDLSRPAKELRYYVLILLKRDSFPEDLRLNLPEAFGREFVSTYSSLNIKVDLDGLENPIADFLDRIEFETFSNNIEEILLRETGIPFRFLENQPVLAAMEACLLDTIKSGDDFMGFWLDAVKGAMSEKLLLDTKILKPPMEIEFMKCDLLSKFKHRLFGVSSSKKLTIQTDHVFLVSSMIEKVANEFLDAPKDFYCCMKIKLEISPELILHIHNLVRSPSVYVLVIDCSHDSLNVDNMKDIFINLTRELDSVPEEIMKKVVVVGTERTLPRILKTEVHDFLTCRSGGIEILSEKSQSRLLQHDDIRLRNTSVKLKELLTRENVVNLLRDPRFFAQFLTGQLFIDDVVPTLPQFDQDTYIPRRTSLRVLIDTNILKEPINDVFIIKEITKAELENYSGSNEIVYTVDEIPDDKEKARLIALEDDLVPFDKFLGGAPRNIHLMDHKNGHLIWLHSIGSISNLIPHRLDDIPESLDPSLFPESLVLKRSKPRIVIICGESGTGKSAYFHEMALSGLPTSSRVWRLKIIFCTDYFRNTSESCFEDVRSTIAYIKERLECSEFLQELFSLCALGKSNLKITLLIDGFDELPADLVGLASRMILQLQKSSIENIYVTVRPGTNRQHLESQLGIFSHNLDAFSQDEECKLLTNFWKKKTNVQVGHSSLEKIARDLLSVFHPVFKCEEFGISGHLSTYPLYLKMLAEIHKNCLTENYNNPNATNNIYGLYKTYVLNTYPRIFYRDIVYKKSLQRLLPVSVFKDLEIDVDTTEASRIELPDELCHITFAELAVSEWLKNQTSVQDQNLVKILQCIDSIAESTSPVFLNSVKSVFNLGDRRCFFSFVNTLAAGDHSHLLKALLKSGNQDWSATANDKTPLHFAVENNRVESVKLLLELQDPDYQKLREHGESKYLPDKDSKLVKFVDKVADGKSAIQVAADSNNMQMVCDLTLAGADLLVLDSNFLKKLSNYVARELSKLELLEEHQLRIVSERLFIVEPDTGLNATDRETHYPRLLPYYFAKGRLEVVQSLMNVVRSQKEKNKLLQEKLEGKSLLDYVNDSTTLMDDLQRRDIVKYLLEEIGSEIRNGNQFYVEPVLKAAIKVNHPKTFKYFVGQYPGGYMGFLESSLKSDDSDIVNFLVYYDQEMKACKIRDSILHTAVRLNVEIKMIEFIINKSSVDVTNNLRETPLCVAIKYKADISVVKYLVSLGANVNAEDEEGLCPWCYILVESSGYSTHEQDELMQFLIELNQELILPPQRNLDYDYDRKRLDIIRKFEYFKNPIEFNLNYQNDWVPRLHSAIRSNKSEDWTWCKFLVEHGADVRLRDSCGKTPLHIAVEYYREELAKFLLQQRATFDDVDNDGNSILQLLVNLSLDSGDQSEILSMWKCLMHCSDRAGRTLLHVAADANETFAIKKMINIDKSREPCSPPLNFDTRDISGDAAIHLAARKDHDNVIELLLSGGANYEMRDYSRKTPLKIAKEVSQFSLSAPLLESVERFFRLVKCDDKDSFKKIDEVLNNNHNIINARDSFGMTALHWSVCSNNTASVVQCLVEKSDSLLNSTDQKNRTALHYAVLKDHPECAKALLEAGAAVDVVDEDGQRPFDLGDGSNKSAQIIREFLENKAKPCSFK